MHSLLLIIHSGNPESRQSIRTLRSAPPTACTFSSLGIIVYHLFNVTYKESWINTVLMFVQVSLHNDMKNVWDILDRPIYCLFLLASSFLNVCLFLFDIDIYLSSEMSGGLGLLSEWIQCLTRLFSANVGPLERFSFD